MGARSFKQRPLLLLSLMLVVWAWLGLGVPIAAQVSCPPADGSGARGDYGTACGKQMVSLDGTVTPYAMTDNRVPGNGSESPTRIPASTGQPTTTRLADQQLQTLLTEGQAKLNTELADLARHFPGPMGNLDYRTAANEFIGLLVTRAEEARNYFLSATMSHPENGTAVNGLLNAMELLAQRWIVRGNEQLADALYRRYQAVGFDLFQVTNGLREADESFRNAVAVYMNYFYLPLSQGPAPTLYDLALQYQPSRRDYTNTVFRDLRLLARAAGRKAFTRREIGQRLFALRDYGAAYDVLAQEELEIMGELLLSAAVYEAISTPQEREAVNIALRELLAERSQITKLLRYLEGGKNVLGLDDDYVEFRFNREIHDPRFNNFTQVRLWAEAKLSDARDAYARFVNLARDFERDVTQYRQSVLQHLNYFDREIILLCGTTQPGRTCPGGALRDARLAIEQANLRIEAVLQEISNLQARITNTIAASDAIRAIREQLAQMVIVQGEQQADLITEMARLQADTARELAELQYRQAVDTGELPDHNRLGGRIAGDAARAAGGISARLEGRRGDLQAQMARMQALQLAEFRRTEDRQRSVEVQKFIKDATLEIISRRIELRMAQLALTQASATLDDRNQQLRRLLEERQTWRNLDGAAEPVFRDPTLRIIRNETLKQYLSDYDEALRRVYLAGRALAYETNRCPGTTCPSLINGLDDVLRIVDVNQLRTKLREMEDVMGDHERFYRTETRRIVLELSKLLGLRTRQINGERRNYKEQFRDCLHPQLRGSAPPERCPRFDVRDRDLDTGLYRTVVFRFPIELGLHLQEFQDTDYASLLSPMFTNLQIRSIKVRIEGPSPVTGQFADLPLSYGLIDPQTGNLIGTMSQRGPDSNVRFERPDRPDIIRRYNAVGAGTATLPAAIGRQSFDSITASSDKFIYRTLGFSDYILILSVDPLRFPANPGLIGPLTNVEDVTFEFTCAAYTLPFE